MSQEIEGAVAGDLKKKGAERAGLASIGLRRRARRAHAASGARCVEIGTAFAGSLLR
jgi:hypothetical protein